MLVFVRKNNRRMEKTSSIIQDRKKKAEELRAMGVNLYPAGYTVDITAAEAFEKFGHMDTATLQDQKETFSMAGRIMSLRNFGKASFIHIKDATGRIQAYIKRDSI